MTRATMTVFAFALVGCATAVSAVFGSSNTADTAVAQGQPPVPAPLRGVGFDQRSTSRSRSTFAFHDEAGREVRLGDYFHGKPVILVLAYYRCPMLCTEVLNGLVRAMLDMSLDAGKDFEVVTVSFDPRETPELAAAKKQTYLERYGRPGGEAGWHFLTGDAGTDRAAHQGRRLPLSLRRATRSVRPRQRHHGADAGREALPLLLRHPLFAARPAAGSGGGVGQPRSASSVDQVLLFCFHYDPAVGQIRRGDHELRPAGRRPDRPGHRRFRAGVVPVETAKRMMNDE